MPNPADDESRIGLPAQGKAGVEMTLELEEAGMPRHARKIPAQIASKVRDGELTTAQVSVVYGGVSVANVIKCQPPGPATGGYARMTAKWRELNAAARKQGYMPLKHPAECCFPALVKTLSKHQNIVALGNEPLKIITGTASSISSRKGAITQIQLASAGFSLDASTQIKIGVSDAHLRARRKFAATYSPSFVLQALGEREGVVADLGKFRRFFTDKLRWDEPGILFNPPVDVALAFLREVAQQPRFFHDWETNAKEPLTAILRCGGIGIPHSRRRIACWACNDRHNGNPQKVAFLKQLAIAKGRDGAETGEASASNDGDSARASGPNCVICDGSGYHNVDFTVLLLTTTSVSPSAERDGCFYTIAEYEQLIAGVNALFAAAESAKPGPGDETRGLVSIGHNANVYDKQAIETSPFRPHHFYARDSDGNKVGLSFDIEIGYAEDTMLDSRYVNPEQRKGLATLGARFEDISVWKEDHEGNKTAIGTKNDWELGVYCCMDICVDGRVYPKARAIAIEHGSHNAIARVSEHGAGVVDLVGFERPYDVDVAAMRRHVGMHRIGVHVNQERRQLFQRLLDTQAAWHLEQFNAIAGTAIKMDDIRTEEDESDTDDDGVKSALSAYVGDASSFIAALNESGVNINSGNQLRELIYKKWKIEKPAILDNREFYTATGAEGCGDHVLRAICVDERTPRQVASALHHLRMAKRKRFKLSITTLSPLARGTREQVAWYWRDAAGVMVESEAWANGIRPAVDKERGFIWPDGVVRPSWSSRTAVFRDDCSEPNMMNIGSRKGGIRFEPFSESAKREHKREKRRLAAEDKKLALDLNESWRLASLFPGAALYDHTWTMLARAYASGDAATMESADMYVAALVGRHLDYKDGVLKGKMKSIFDAKPGLCLVGGDMDQLHLRIIANLYKIPILLEAFEKGQDPHNALAFAVFGDKFVKASGWGPAGFSLYRKPIGGDALQMREAMKTFRYAVIYGASPDTAWRVYVAVENDVGGLPFSGNWVTERAKSGEEKRVWKPLKKTEIREYHDRWRKAEPEWETNFWQPCQAAYAANAALSAGMGGAGIHAGAVGFLIDPLFGTRSGALEGGSPSATSNWTVLRTEAVIMRIVERRMMELYPYGSSKSNRRGRVDYWKRFGNPHSGDVWDLGVNSQVHDWLCAQIVDESDSDDIAASAWGKRTLAATNEAMNVVIPGHAVKYSCEAGIGRGMHEV